MPLVCVVLAALAACGPGERPQSAPRTQTSVAPTSTVPLSAWQEKGATEAPPSSVSRVSLTGIEVLNQTGGKVSDTEAQRWAEAMLRTLQYALWATARMQQDFLLNSGLSDSPSRVFGPNLGLISQARTLGASQITVTPITIRRLAMRPVGDQLQGVFTNAGFTWAPYAFYIGEVGPYSATVVDREQRTVPVDRSLPAGAGAAELVSGRLRTDPVLGAIWVAGSDWDCINSASRQTFGGLCAP